MNLEESKSGVKNVPNDTQGKNNTFNSMVPKVLAPPKSSYVPQFLKMPIFGSPSGNVTWPSSEVWQQWDLNQKIFVSSISFKQGDALRGIQFSLSNGVTSPLIETPEGKRLPLQSVNLDTTKTIKKVSVYVAPENEYMWGMKLISDKEDLVFSQNWFEYNPH